LTHRCCQHPIPRRKRQRPTAETVFRLVIVAKLPGNVWPPSRQYPWSHGVSCQPLCCAGLLIETCDRFRRHSRRLSRILLQEPSVQRQSTCGVDRAAHRWHSAVPFAFSAAPDRELSSLQGIHDVDRHGVGRGFFTGRGFLDHGKDFGLLTTCKTG
jgi:hypothetical protein